MERANIFKYPEESNRFSRNLPSLRIYSAITNKYTNIKIYIPKIFHVLSLFSACISGVILLYILSDLSTIMSDFCPTRQYSDWAVIVFFFGITVMISLCFQWRFYLHFLICHTVGLFLLMIIFENRVMQFRIFDLTDSEIQFYEASSDKLFAFSQCLLSLKIGLGLTDVAFIIDCFLLIIYFCHFGIGGLFLNLRRAFKSFKMLSSTRRMQRYNVSF